MEHYGPGEVATADGLKLCQKFDDVAHAILNSEKFEMKDMISYTYDLAEMVGFLESRHKKDRLFPLQWKTISKVDTIDMGKLIQK
ncbi:hypothetical protein AtubIFM54640_010845 [Aspergillus tubingensis]|nr:hypothetical protein AtubIFM54640_010845 [Aspergillus tubingensis]